MTSQITSLTIVYTSVYLGANLRKHHSSASLAFVRGIHRWPVNSQHKGPVTRKMFPFDDVIMIHKLQTAHSIASIQQSQIYTRPQIAALCTDLRLKALRFVTFWKCVSPRENRGEHRSWDTMIATVCHVNSDRRVGIMKTPGFYRIWCIYKWPWMCFDFSSCFTRLHFSLLLLFVMTLEIGSSASEDIQDNTPWNHTPGLMQNDDNNDFWTHVKDVLYKVEHRTFSVPDSETGLSVSTFHRQKMLSPALIGQQQVCRRVCDFCQIVGSRSVSALCYRHCEQDKSAFKSCLALFHIRTSFTSSSLVNDDIAWSWHYLVITGSFFPKILTIDTP